jgi:putative DNA methylase
MIERWFPCAEVSAAANTTWGRGKTEKSLFTWFAARPPAQARAAVLCSVLRWPEDDQQEQRRLQDLVVGAMHGRGGPSREIRQALSEATDTEVAILDPFCGRGMIPLEAARFGLSSRAFDYSPVAALASRLLVEYPFRDWSDEPSLPFDGTSSVQTLTGSRLVADVDAVLNEIGRRWTKRVACYFPAVNGSVPWGYVWSVTLPCAECGIRFPLVGSYELRKSAARTDRNTKERFVDPGQSFYIDVNRTAKTFTAVVHDGPPVATPTLSNAIDPAGRKIPGKAAHCPFCMHPHPLAAHRRMTASGLGQDVLLVVADHSDRFGKAYRSPTSAEFDAAERASHDLRGEDPIASGIPAIPDETIAGGNNNIIGPSIYGARSYGDLMADRQTLTTIRLVREIRAVALELRELGLSEDYVRALSGYAGAALVKKVKHSTRGATLHLTMQAVNHIYANEGSLSFSYDFFEAGIGSGPGTWDSMISGNSGVTATLRNLISDGVPSHVARGSATSLPIRTGVVTAVVTDPPYDQMIAYADSSDIFFVWLKRALLESFPELRFTSEDGGTQEKADEIIVKRVRGDAPNEHRTRDHYDSKIAAAFREMRRTVTHDGVVTIVFGHGEPEVWQRLLAAIAQANLVMTASWPANTEAGGQQGKANIETTLTMACRPAPVGRSPGRKGVVEGEIKAEIRRRYPNWERWGLAPADMLMAAAGPAMEVVGRYSEVLDSRGEQVDIHTFLPLARAAVQEAMAVEIDHRPLDAFDSRTRFALWWARLYGRQPQAKSELRWQTLASSIPLETVRDLVDGDKAVALITSDKFTSQITQDSAVIDVALVLAAASEQGLAAMGDVLAASPIMPDDPFLWATVQFLADRLPDSDPDSVAFHRVLRARAGIGTAAENVAETVRAERLRQDREDRQIKLL